MFWILRRYKLKIATYKIIKICMTFSSTWQLIMYEFGLNLQTKNIFTFLNWTFTYNLFFFFLMRDVFYVYKKSEENRLKVVYKCLYICIRITLDLSDCFSHAKSEPRICHFISFLMPSKNSRIVYSRGVYLCMWHTYIINQP